MEKQRRKFSPEYKDKAVRLVIGTGRSTAAVARELGVMEPTLVRWVHLHKARQDAGAEALSEIELTLIRPTVDRPDLVRFLSQNRFPFHVGERLSESDANARVDNGAFTPPQNVGYWIHSDGLRQLGYVVFEDLDGGSPLIDLRIAEPCRGNGYGTRALMLATTRVFDTYPGLNRIEGNTRVDNRAMRRVFTKCGYAKEAHYRQGWTVEGHAPLAAVAYAILRQDWSTGSVTPVPWGE